MAQFYKEFFGLIGRVLKLGLKMAIMGFLWVYQLPQNLLALLLIKIFECYEVPLMKADGSMVWFFSGRLPFPFSAISLGEYIIFDFRILNNMERIFKHEAGHRIQSRILGPAYLFIIGLFSSLWALLYKRLRLRCSYYCFPTEKNADFFGGVKR